MSGLPERLVGLLGLLGRGLDLGVLYNLEVTENTFNDVLVIEGLAKPYDC